MNKLAEMAAQPLGKLRSIRDGYEHDLQGYVISQEEKAQVLCEECVRYEYLHSNSSTLKALCFPEGYELISNFIIYCRAVAFKERVMSGHSVWEHDLVDFKS